MILIFLSQSKLSDLLLIIKKISATYPMDRKNQKYNLLKYKEGMKLVIGSTQITHKIEISKQN